MESYKLNTIVSKDGKIQLPRQMKKIFNHKVKIVLLDIEHKRSEHKKKSTSAQGILQEYTNRELSNKESQFLEEALLKKHGVR